MKPPPRITATIARLHHRPAAAAVALALVAASCAGGTDQDQPEAATGTETSQPSDDDTGSDDSTPAALSFEGPLTVVVPNSPGTLGTVGTQRVMTALVGNGPNAFLGGPDQPVSIRFDPVDGQASGGQAGEADGTWLTTNAAALGLYVSYFDFSAPGLWEITVTAGGEDLGAALVEVVDDPTVPNVGDPAPPSESPTGITVDELAAISTDPDPDPSLYDLSIAEAVSNGRPTVVAFATPAFCQTALCGPTLEAVKAATAGREGIDVVHVEPFDLALAPQGTLQPIPSMADWGLVTEPWVFVIDADGLVAASFEGIIGQAELEAAVDRL